MALQRVDVGRLDRLERDVLLKQCAHSSCLRVVHANDDNLCRLGTSREKGDDRCDRCSRLGRIGDALAALAALLVALPTTVMPEHRRLQRVHPRKGDVSPQAVVRVRAVAEQAVVEGLRGELGDGGVHAVLHVEHDVARAREAEPLEQ